MAKNNKLTGGKMYNQNKSSSSYNKRHRNRKKTEYFSDTLLIFFSKHYFTVLIIALIFAFIIYCSVYENITTPGVQGLFALAAVIVAGCAVYLSSKRKFNLNTLAVFSIIFGIIIRLCYMFYTNYKVRQHDLLGSYGHLQYILDIARKFALPVTGEDQAYHPPVHHIISAITFNFGKFLGLNDLLSVSIIQMIMVLFSSMSLIFIYKILTEVKCGAAARFTGVAFFAFHPTNIYFSSFLNNDNTLLMFSIISFYQLIKWLNNKSTKNIIYLSIFITLAILTKKNAVLILPVVFTVFLVEFIKNFKNYKPYLRQFITFALITIPLSASYQIRNFILFHQGLGYTRPVFFKPFSNSIYNLFFVSPQKLFTHPFTEDPFLNLQSTDKNELFTEYLFKSSLFGEWRFPGLENTARFLISVSVIIVLIIIFCLLYQKLSDFKSYGYIFLLNMGITLAFVFQSRLYFPFVCTQNFRYAAPILISAAFFLGKAADRLFEKNNFILKYLIPGCVILFSIASTMFILQIGVPDIQK